MIERAQSFGRTAEQYERTRPDYPDEILDALPLTSTTTVVDVGAGTGKLTRVLARRYRRVIAVEPSDGMRAVLERAVPGAEAVKGTAEEIPLPDASADGVFAAQAFHWFRKDVALPEFARVLRTGGIVAVVWNGPDESRPSPVPADFAAALESLHDEAPQPWLEEPEWEELLEQTGLFAEVHRRTSVPHDHVLDRASMLENLRTVSWIATRDDAEEQLARLGSMLPEGTYAMPNLAYVFWAARA